MLEVKGDFQEKLEVRGHPGSCAGGAEGRQRLFARKKASAGSLYMTATRASVGYLPRTRRRL